MEANQYLEHLHDFIVQAKAATYVGDGEQAAPCRKGSHDLAFAEGAFSYLDSYFGGEDFIGQEVVYYEDRPVWAMNYYGKILMPRKISGAETGAIIKESLSKMYQQGRFLGGFQHTVDEFEYYDTSIGGFSAFSGREWITHNGEIVYELLYHGGLIK
jgi:hypothetical protein